MTDYTSVKIPKKLADRIKLVAIMYGYRSVSEYILHHTRNHLVEDEEQLKRQEKLGRLQ